MSKLVIRKRIVGYTYPKNGNFHNPTPRIRYEVWMVYNDKSEHLVDAAYKKSDLKKDWPLAK